jgi:hypothetical protein
MIMDTLDNFMRGCCNSNSTVTSHVPFPVGDGQQLTKMKKKQITYLIREEEILHEKQISILKQQEVER